MTTPGWTTPGTPLRLQPAVSSPLHLHLHLREVLLLLLLLLLLVLLRLLLRLLREVLVLPSRPVFSLESEGGG